MPFGGGGIKLEIIIVGCGKVGSAIAKRLSEEGHNITVIDKNAEKVNHLTEEIDVMGMVGNGSSIDTLMEAGLERAEVVIAVTGSDELNMLCCMFAKKNSTCHTIARVRNPEYIDELDFIKDQLNISAIINPELAAAREIALLLFHPAALKIDAFAEGRAQLIKIELPKDSPMSGKQLKDIGKIISCDMLVCAVERNGNVTIPRGDFVFEDGDIISFLATPEQANTFFERLHLPYKQVKNALIVGGSTLGFYLAKSLLERHIDVRIVEQDIAKCEELAVELPKVTVIHGDGADRQLLMAEGLQETEAMVALTSIDEENILLSLYAKKHSSAKLITKVNRLEFDDITDGLDIGSVIYPKYITSDSIVQYVRALRNAAGNNVKTLYRILDDRVEALEFDVSDKSNVTDIPLSQLKLKNNLLICCIDRGGKIIIPRGSDTIQVGDAVIVVTLEQGLHDLSDILK